MMLSRRCALPVGFAFTAIAYVQTSADLIPLDPAKDPTALMVGWSSLARQVDDVARNENASYVLTSNYGLTSLLGIYSRDPVIQFNERLRWVSFEQPRAALFLHTGLYVSEINKDKSGDLQRRFSEVTLVGTGVRLRGTRAIKRYVIYRLAKPVGPVLDGAER